MVRPSARRTAAPGLLALAAALAAPAGSLAAQAPQPGDSVPPAAADTAPPAAPDTAVTSDTAATPDTAPAAADADPAAAGEATARDSTTGDADAGPPTPRLSGEVTGDGDAATLRLLLDPSGLGTPVAAYRLELSWDPAALELRGVEPGDFGGDLATSTDSAPGRLLAEARRSEGGVDSAAALLTASFAAGPALDGGERADVALEVTELRGEDGVALADSLRRRPSPLCLQALPPGDVDGDGAVTSRDAVSVLRRQVGMKVDRSADVSRADLDADGSADRSDAVRLLRRQVGLPPVSDSAASGADGAGAVSAGDSAASAGDSASSAGDPLVSASEREGAVADGSAAPERPALGACP